MLPGFLFLATLASIFLRGPRYSIILATAEMSSTFTGSATSEATAGSVALVKLRCLSVKTGTTTYPTSDPKLSVIETFPSGISAEDSDPFLLCHHFGPTISPGAISANDPDNFPIAWHPHRGMDIATYMIAGVGRHGDSLGNRESYQTPGMQWISVGSGIEHAEGGGTPKGDPMQGFQIWINVPAKHKMDDPAYGTHPPSELPSLEFPGAKGRLLAGRVGDVEGPFKTKQPVEMIDLTISPGATLSHHVAAIYDNTLIHIYNGSGTILGSKVAKNQVANLNSETANDERILTITADPSGSGLSVIIFSGKRIREPISWHGPFVMNTKAEIDTCIKEYRSGNFLKKRVAWDYKRLATAPKLKEDL